MAFAGGEDGEPAVFEDPAFPCVQFLRLEALLATGSTCGLSTYQNDANWGLCHDIDEPLRSKGWDGIFRYIEDPDLPTGPIGEVTVWLADSGDVAEVLLEIGGRDLLLVAGEVYEDDLDRPLYLGWLDESVLAFASPDQAETINWMYRGPRHRVQSSNSGK